MRIHIFLKAGRLLWRLLRASAPGILFCSSFFQKLEGLSAGIILMSLGFHTNSADPAAFPEKPSAHLGKGTVQQIAYSPDGKLLAVAGSAGIWLYDANNLNEVGLLQGHISWVYSVAFSPDGKWLASGSYDGTILLWEVNLQVPGRPVEPNGKQLVTWGDVKRNPHTGMERTKTANR